VKSGYSDEYQKIACFAHPCQKDEESIPVLISYKTLMVFNSKPDKSIYCEPSADSSSPSTSKDCVERTGIGSAYYVQDGIVSDKGACKGLDCATYIDEKKPSLIYANEKELYYYIGNDSISIKNFTDIFQCGLSSTATTLIIISSMTLIISAILIIVYIIIEVKKDRNKISDEITSNERTTNEKFTNRKSLNKV